MMRAATRRWRPAPARLVLATLVAVAAAMGGCSGEAVDEGPPPAATVAPAPAAAKEAAPKGPEPLPGQTRESYDEQTYVILGQLLEAWSFRDSPPAKDCDTGAPAVEGPETGPGPLASEQNR